MEVCYNIDKSELSPQHRILDQCKNLRKYLFSVIIGKDDITDNGCFVIINNSAIILNDTV